MLATLDHNLNHECVVFFSACLLVCLSARGIHSAGIGRTGCFIATSILCKQLINEGVVDILKTTSQLRLDR